MSRSKSPSGCSLSTEADEGFGVGMEFAVERIRWEMRSLDNVRGPLRYE